MDRFFQEFLGRSKYVALALDYIIRLNPSTDQAEMIRQELSASGHDPDNERLVSAQRTRFSRIMDEFEKDLPFQVLTPERPKKLTPKGQELRELLISLKTFLRGTTSTDQGALSVCGLESLISAFVEPRCGPFVRGLQEEHHVLEDLRRKKPSAISAEQLAQKLILANLKIRILESRNDESSFKSIKAGGVDLAVVTEIYFKSLGKIDKKDLHNLPLGGEEYCWAFPCDQRQVVKFLEKAKAGQLPLVKLSGKGPINQKLKKLFPKADWRIETSNFEGVRRVLRRNRTMGGILTSSAADGIEGFALLPCKLFDSKNGCILICRKDGYRTAPKISSFYNFFRDNLNCKKQKDFALP